MDVLNRFIMLLFYILDSNDRDQDKLGKVRMCKKNLYIES